MHACSVVSKRTAMLSIPHMSVLGGIATATADALLFPIDSIKVAQQADPSLARFDQAIRSILRNADNKKIPITALFRGVIGYSVIDGLGAAIFFAVYERVKAAMDDRSDALSLPILKSSAPYLSACVAFTCSSVLMVPAEMIKIKLQRNVYPTLAVCIKSLVQESGGIAGLYSGYTGAHSEWKTEQAFPFLYIPVNSLCSFRHVVSLNTTR
jgi:Mitochondrial carrier protein